MKRALEALALITTLGLAIACGDRVTATAEPPKPEPFVWPEGPAPTAVLHIAGMGTIELALYPSLAPATVDNFVKLAGEGFYDGTSFHRVVPGFMIQGGDPNTRDRDPTDDGNGGPGYNIQDEFSDAPHERGVLSMANVGQPDSGGSQFFIVHGDARHLDNKHTVFGRVVSGLEVVDAITVVETDLYGRWGPKNRPIANVMIEKVEIRPAG